MKHKKLSRKVNKKVNDNYRDSGQEMTDYFLSGRRDDSYYESFRLDWEIEEEESGRSDLKERW